MRKIISIRLITLKITFLSLNELLRVELEFFSDPRLNYIVERAGYQYIGKFVGTLMTLFNISEIILYRMILKISPTSSCSTSSQQQFFHIDQYRIFNNHQTIIRVYYVLADFKADRKLY